MRLRLKIAATTLSQLVGRGISAASSFIITILIARQFGVEAYGDFVKITTFVAFFYLLADFGLNAITVKELGHNLIKSGAFYKNENKVQTLKTLFSARILLGIGLTWFAVMLTVFLPYSTETGEGFSRLTKLGIIVFAPTITLHALIRSTNAYFQFRLRYDKATLAIICGSLTSLILVGIIVVLNISSILTVVAVFLIATALHSAVAVMLLRKMVATSLGLTFNLLAIAGLLKKSLPLGLTLALNIAFFRLDTFLLAIFRPTTEVGLYGLAYKFFEFPLALPTFFMNAVYPVLVNLDPLPRRQVGRTSNADKTKFQVIIKKSAIFLLISSIVLTTAFWFIAPYITLIKDDFAGSVALFRLLILWLPLFFLSSLFMWVLIAKEDNWRLAGIYAVGLLVNATLNLVFIPIYGSTAAALTTGATELLILVLLVLQIYRR